MLVRTFAAALLAAALHAQAPQYVGSAACKTCHAEVYGRWSKTRMANVVRDPHQHPDAITPDLNKLDLLLTFKKEDIAFVYGSKWKQRYFKKVGDDYFPLPAHSIDVASWLFPCEAVEKFIQAVQLILQVGEFVLLRAVLRFGIDLAGLQALLIGRHTFNIGLYLGQVVFLSLALCRILRAFDFFLRHGDKAGYPLHLRLSLAERRARVLQARGGARYQSGLSLQAIEHDLHALRHDRCGLQILP